MYSVKVIKNIFEDLKRITKADYALYGQDGTLLYGTFKSQPVKQETIGGFISSGADSQTLEGFYFFRVKSEKADNMILVVNGYGGDGYMFGRIALSELACLLGMGDDASDLDDLYRGIIFDRMLPGDIEREAGRLKVPAGLQRCVYCIKTDGDVLLSAGEMIRNMYSDSKDDYLFTDNENTIVLIKAIKNDDPSDIAGEILSMINTELMVTARVSYGKTRTGLSDIRESYLEADMAMEIGDIFFEEMQIVSYQSLGLGRIIYQLPMSLCTLFTEEVFGESSAEVLTESEIKIINSFFDNSLSIAGVVRDLDIKRSTLVHRLDVIEKKVGLDIRKFDDAMTLKVALMVTKYMEYRKRKSGEIL